MQVGERERDESSTHLPLDLEWIVVDWKGWIEVSVDGSIFINPSCLLKSDHVATRHLLFFATTTDE
jgi:hypothetical protein